MGRSLNDPYVGVVSAGPLGDYGPVSSEPNTSEAPTSAEASGQPADAVSAAEAHAKTAETFLNEVSASADAWLAAKTTFEDQEDRAAAAREELEQAAETARAELNAAIEGANEPLRQARDVLESLQQGSSEREREVADLRALVEKRRKTWRQLQEEGEHLVHELGQAVKRRTAAQAELDGLAEEKQTAREHLDKLASDIAAANQALHDKRAEADKLAQDSQEARASSEEEAERVEAEEVAVAAAAEELTRREAALGEASAAAEVTQEALEQAQAAHQEAEQAQQKGKKAEKEARKALADAEEDDEIAAAEEARQEKRAALKELGQAEEEARAALEAARSAHDDAAGVRAAAEGEVDEARAALSAAETKRDETKAECTAAQRADEMAQAALAAAEMRDLAEVASQGLEREVRLAEESIVEFEEREQAIETELSAHVVEIAKLEERQQDLEAALSEADALRSESEERLRAAESSLSGEQGSQQRVLLELQRVETLFQERRDQLADLAGDVPAARPSVSGAEDDELEAESWDALAWCGEADDGAEEAAESEPEPAPPAHSAAKSGEPTFRLSVSLPNEHLAEYEFAQEEIVIGRDETCDVTLDSPVISRRHALIKVHDALYALIDQGSGNGTFLNGKRVDGMSLLNDGDGIGIGKYRLRFSAEIASGFKVDGLDAEAMDLGGMTLRLAPEEAKRQGDTHDRARGLLVLPGPKDGGPVRVPLGEVFMVGKDPACDMAIKGWFVPKRAAVIARGLDRYTLVNTASNRDVTVNGEAVRTHRPLEHNDRIEIYGQRFIFLLPGAE